MSRKHEQADPASRNSEEDVPKRSKVWVARLSLQGWSHASNTQFKQRIYRELQNDLFNQLNENLEDDIHFWPATSWR